MRAIWSDGHVLMAANSILLLRQAMQPVNMCVYCNWWQRILYWKLLNRDIQSLVKHYAHSHNQDKHIETRISSWALNNKEPFSRYARN